MKKQVLFLFILFSFVVSQGQEALVASGADGSGTGGTFSYSVGQAAYEYRSGAGGSASDGVQQAYVIMACAIQQINLVTGWNLISSYVFPDSPNMLDVLSPIASDVILLKDGVGAVVLPSIPLNLVGDWDVTEGYQLKMQNNSTLDISCTPVIPETTPIPLSTGWAIISYLRDSEMDASIALASINDNLILVKDNAGNVYFPQIALNLIGNMQPGQGYLIKMNTTDTLLYPANTMRLSTPVVPYTPQGEPQRLQYTGNTGNNATIILPKGSIEGLKIGDEIGVYNANMELCGSALYEGRHTAITVWGNDVATLAEEHMNVGEPYRYKIFRPSEHQEYDLLVEYQSGSPNFSTNGISILKKGAVPDMNGQDAVVNVSQQLSVYPNPAADLINAAIWLEEPAAATIRIYDLRGKLVLAPITHVLDRGHSLMKIDISSLANGNYLYRMETPELLFNGKIVKQ